MAAMGLSLAWSLLLPSLLQAFSLPTQDSPPWNSSLGFPPELPSPNGPAQVSNPPAVPHPDHNAHEVSSGDGEPKAENGGSANPTVHPGPPILMLPFDFPAVMSSASGAPTDAPGGRLAPQGGDSSLQTRGPFYVKKEPDDIFHATVESSPRLGKNGDTLSLLGITVTSVAGLGTASSPASSREHALDLTASRERTTHSDLQALFKDVSMATTLSPRPTVSTIPLVTLPTKVSHIKWMVTEGIDPRGDDSTGQELLGRNQTTVKYLASYRSTQVYGSPQGKENLSTTPFRPALETGSTQNPLGQWRGTMVVSTSQTPQLTSMAVPVDSKDHGLAFLPEGSHHSAPEDLFLSPSTPPPAEGKAGTPGPGAHERITHWGLIVDTTQQPRIKDTTGTEQTHLRDTSTKPAFSSFATPGTGVMVEVDPQRVRGAVNPWFPVGAATPGQGTSVAGKGPGTRPPDPSGTRLPGQGSTVLATPSFRLPATPRRGLIRVTTQRALQHPQLARPEPSRPALLPAASSPPCPRPGSPCSPFLPNRTLLRWEDLERTLSFAWALHVYGSGVLFLLLSLLSLACLVGSLAVRVPHLLYVVGASALLLAFGVLRATFFLADPYGSRGRFPARALRVLYTAPFPLLLSTFVVLLLRLLRQAHLQVLPPRLQSLLLWALLGTMQSTLLLAADVLTPPMHPAVAVGLHMLSCAASCCLLPITIFVYWQLRRSTVTGGTPEPGLWSGAWLLLGSSVFALPCCGLQLYGVLWLSGLLAPPGFFTWGWWFMQFWFRIGEFALSFALLFLAWQALCQRYRTAEHSCWTKLMRYFCTYRKVEVPEYPNNCYDWTGGVLEKVPNADISKSLIRNPPASERLWALKDSNELRAAAGRGSSPSPAHPVYSPKCPNAAATAMGRSYTSICFERDSVLSLAELEFRPPSPINLSRSIDEALFREHLVRDSIFLRSSLHFPSRMARQDSCSSLRGECSTLSHTAQPLLAQPRRSSDPDCLYSLARASSMGELTTQSRGLASEPPTDTSFDSYSRTSFSRASLKISWNPWRHGLSSPESLPPEELPCQAQLLPEEPPPAPSSSAPNSEGEVRRSFLALSKQVDSRSLSSDTIEL